MLIPKTNISVGDRVEYKHPLSSPFEGFHASAEGYVTEIANDRYRVSFRLGQSLNSRSVSLSLSLESLIVVEKIPDPNFLSKKIANASKVKECDYLGKYIFDDYSGQYFETSDDLLEYYEREGLEDPPAFAFATTKHIFKVSEVEDLVSSLENPDEEDIGLIGVAKLQAAIDEFNLCNQRVMTSYHQDYSTLVVFNS